MTDTAKHIETLGAIIREYEQQLACCINWPSRADPIKEKIATLTAAIESLQEKSAADRAWERVRELLAPHDNGFVCLHHQPNGYEASLFHSDMDDGERIAEGYGPTPQAAVLAAKEGT